MAKLQLHDYIRLAVKGICILCGLLGLFWFYIGIVSIANSIVEKRYGSIAFSSIMLVISIYLIYVCFIVVKRFSARALRHFSAVAAVCLYSGLGFLLRPWTLSLRERGMGLWGVFLIFGPLILMVLFYYVLYKLLARLSKVQK